MTQDQMEYFYASCDVVDAEEIMNLHQAVSIQNAGAKERQKFETMLNRKRNSVMKLLVRK